MVGLPAMTAFEREIKAFLCVVGIVKYEVFAPHYPKFFTEFERWLPLHGKNDKLNEMPCYHKLEEYLDAYIKAAGIHGRPTSAGRSPACAISIRQPGIRPSIQPKLDCGAGPR